MDKTLVIWQLMHGTEHNLNFRGLVSWGYCRNSMKANKTKHFGGYCRTKSICFIGRANKVKSCQNKLLKLLNNT